MNRLHLRVVAVLCALACAVVTAVSVYPRAARFRAAGRNGDGRPERWRLAGERGQPVEIDIDSNADGRPDIEEYYDGGALVRRESDRNFDDRVDLVEEFDTGTRAHVRSVVDVDYDGTADLLVLFHDGTPVFSEYAAAGARVARASSVVTDAGSPAGRRLLPLADPFRSETTLRTARARVAPAEHAAVSTATGLPMPRAGAGVAIDAAALLADADVDAGPVLPAAASPRAPPLS